MGGGFDLILLGSYPRAAHYESTYERENSPQVSQHESHLQRMRKYLRDRFDSAGDPYHGVL